MDISVRNKTAMTRRQSAVAMHRYDVIIASYLSHPDFSRATFAAEFSTTPTTPHH